MSDRTRALAFVSYCAAGLLLNVNLVPSFLALATGDESASHVVVIPLVSLFLIYQRREAVFASPRFDPIGLPVVAAGVAGWIASGAGTIESSADVTFGIAALVVMWLGGFLVFYGRAAFAAGLFPLLFLAFMIPIPDAVLGAAVQTLKRGSAEAVAALFRLTGTPHYRDGFVFALPTFAIEIADECSGIRSSIALLLTSLLAGDAFLRNTWSKAVLVAVVLPLAILKNGVRIVGLSLLAIHVDPEFLTGQLHNEGGIVFFVASLVLFVPVLALLRRYEYGLAPRIGRT
jgi:exosortase